jgi:hypothetical protein
VNKGEKRSRNASNLSSKCGIRPAYIGQKIKQKLCFDIKKHISDHAAIEKQTFTIISF